jgi:hypothetical protein
VAVVIFVGSEVHVGNNIRRPRTRRTVFARPTAGGAWSRGEAINRSIQASGCSGPYRDCASRLESGCMAVRRPQRHAQETALPVQIGGQQDVVEMHSKAIEAGDTSPKRAAALVAATRRLTELQSKLNTA